VEGVCPAAAVLLSLLEHPMNYVAHLVRDPATCGGETVFRGTRVLLRAVLADLADGAAIQDILRDFPSLTEEHGRAAIAFAAAAARDDMPVLAITGTGEGQARREPA
jgi:uncharacterized protein (DUF433 family)